MLVPLLMVAFGILCLVGGGESLLRGGVGLATLLRLTPAVIGLTVVAAGTSVPELAVSGIAAYRGSADIAVANVIGSNIFNVTVILGLCALIRPFAIVGNTLWLEYPILALSTLLAVILLEDGLVSRLDAVLLLLLYVSFTAYLIRLVRRQLTVAETEQLQAEVTELTPVKKPNLFIAVGLLVIGIGLLGVGAQLTVAGASQLARMWGWSERLIGLTIVSVGTGLPEVVASLVSSLRGRSDMAIGNVIGSNLFNLMVILGLSGIMQPLPVQAGIVNSDCWWMLGSTLLLLPVLLSSRKVHRWEGGMLVAVYVIYLVLLMRAPTA